MKQPSQQAQEGLNALREAVRQALDRKRRLGQYAVVWRDDHIELLDWRESEPPRSEPHR